MWQRNKGKIIFVVIFAVVAIAVTAVATWYTISKNKIAEENSENIEVFKLSNEKTAKGIGKYDTYDENPLEIKKIDEKQNNIEIHYEQISGLKDEELEKKINNEIKEAVYNYDKTKYVTSSSANIQANFGNVLSVNVNYCYQEKNGDFKYDETVLNYNLVNGEKLKFKDLFVSETEALRILRESAYEDLAWVYYWSGREDNRTNEEIADGNLDMKKIEYGEIEEKLNEIILAFRDRKLDNSFSFSNVNITCSLEDNTFVSISMSQYIESIAIYNRFMNVKLDEIYKDTKIGKKNLIVLTYRNETDYEIREENDNYYIDMRIEKNDDIKYSNEVEKILKNKIDKKAQEIREIANKSGKFYIVNYAVYLNKSKGEQLGVEDSLATYICEKGDWSSIKDKLYNEWRNFDGASVNPTGNFWIDENDVINYEYENRYIELDSKGKEIIIEKNDAVSKVEEINLKFNTIEMGFEIEKQNEKNKIENYYILNNLFTENGLRIFKENAKDYLKTEIKKEEESSWEEYFLIEKDKYQVGIPELFFKSNIEIEEITADTINAKIESIFFKNDESQKAYYDTNDENGDYFEKYNIEIELIRVNSSDWKINNYTIK